MKEIITATYKQTRRPKTVLVDIPTLCPFCHKHSNPIIEYITPIDTWPNGKESFVTLLKCAACHNFFLATFTLSSGEDIQFNSVWCTPTTTNLSSYEPQIEINIQKEIHSISPMFCEIYKQALLAEAFNLNELTGVGLRKSIEFLIKDFLTSNLQNEEEKTKIRNLTLSKAIDKLSDVRVKTLALAATWLGNDETHYVRKWEDKDINDMKQFVNTLLHFLSCEISLQQSAFMINPNPSKGS